MDVENKKSLQHHHQPPYNNNNNNLLWVSKMSNKQRSVTAVTARETFNQVNFHIKYLNNS